MKLIQLIGKEGIKCDIVPKTDGYCITEVWNKKGEYLCQLIFDYRKKWNKFVLIDLGKDMQMSKECIDEAFKLTEEYWKGKLQEEKENGDERVKELSKKNFSEVKGK